MGRMLLIVRKSGRPKVAKIVATTFFLPLSWRSRKWSLSFFGKVVREKVVFLVINLNLVYINRFNNLKLFIMSLNEGNTAVGSIELSDYVLIWLKERMKGYNTKLDARVHKFWQTISCCHNAWTAY